MEDYCEICGLAFDTCELREEFGITEWLKEYAARPQTEEELFEMRAAFGEGETVVNIFTGRVTVL